MTKYTQAGRVSTRNTTSDGAPHASPLRTILVNVIFAIANGQTITTEAMRALIDRADQEKASRAT